MTTKKIEQRTANIGFKKLAVQCSADIFVVNQSLVIRINIFSKIATSPSCKTLYGDFKKEYADHKHHI
jgi:hypothetical protein